MYDVSVGEDGWQLELDRSSKGSVARALAARRPGQAWAMASLPGVAFHAAMCRSAGLAWDEACAASNMARLLGRSPQGYHRLMHEASVKMVADVAGQYGMYTVILPGEPIRYIVGDMPMELGDVK